MHNRDARAHGEHQTRLDTVAAWREAPLFTPRERAALAWCETLTELPRAGAPDAVFAAVDSVFSAEDTAALTLAIVAINGWNRLAVGLGSDVTSLDGLDLPRDANTSASG
ncbi:MAG: carboxymuconolactone decarboxylase family protein [Streptosporangiaceae bacterium]